MRPEKNIIGIDAGSITISLVELDTTKKVVQSRYQTHNGDIRGTLRQMLANIDWSTIGGLATTDSTPEILTHTTAYDSKVALIAATRHLRGKTGSLLVVGGEKFGLISFDADGEYLKYRSNSSCAAGTGSFLDQQARRLNLDSIERFSDMAYRNEAAFPKIASRCAVFAKTDLIHAQQEGYSLEAICDGLSYGLAKSIVDTLFIGWEPTPPLVMVGGVSQNKAVVRHLADLLKIEIETPPNSPLYGAIGCALCLLDDEQNDVGFERFDGLSLCDLFNVRPEKKQYSFPPLELTLSDYPDFRSLKRYHFLSEKIAGIPPVETDIYHEMSSDSKINVHLGIDIGSTSTKAVLMDKDGVILAGFYTRTSGQPIEAFQAILEAITAIETENDIRFHFLSAGTTGSGRQFVGEIIGADLALDEISAHARAAVELNPDVDTIIEIGGQDSKFTTLKDGSVTFSIMNNVCAAGTGSFIEEQAKKLGCPIEDYATRTKGQTSPMTSDKCTVFMERDLNVYINEGYTVNEALTSTLHAVRDNYLTKVAIVNTIGKTIFFQGATAKNPALVAAFEQKLGKPILVSPFCHLTGAMGVALTLRDTPPNRSRFRGLSLHTCQIPVKTEVCELCANHCKIKLAEVKGDPIAFGFLCGRDYDDQRYVRQARSGFDLKKTRKMALSVENTSKPENGPIVGIPAALHLFDEVGLWQRFFNALSIQTITSEKCPSPVNEGKKIMGAEFCAPVAALHGHVSFLADQADIIFLPDYLEVENSTSEARRQYCYYTQYISSLITELPQFKQKDRVLNPTIRTIRGSLADKFQLYRSLRHVLPETASFLKVSSAYDKAVEAHRLAQDKLKSVTSSYIDQLDDIGVVLLGRPYTVLSPGMNGHIPDIFAKQGVPTFYQDMIVTEAEDSDKIKPLLDSLHWRFAAEILHVADTISDKKGLYPVLITSFKCTPDAFVIDLFKQLMSSKQKPYLILQLDDHDSSVGYETRIEAGIRSFKNHFKNNDSASSSKGFSAPAFLSGPEILKGKTLLLPSYDRFPTRLIEAALRHEGIDARMVDETNDTIRKGVSLNTGQCMPASWITQAAIDYIETHHLDPSKTMIWSVDSNISCNIGVMNHLLKNALETHGKGMEAVQIYSGELTYLDISYKMTLNAFFAYMFGGLLKKMGCKYRPYEQIPGQTDKAIARAMDIFYDTFLNGHSKDTAVKQVVALFGTIKLNGFGTRPKVAIFGDLYARDNEVVNQNLIRTIEENGGEAITTPYNEYLKIIADPFIKKWVREGLYSAAATAKILSKTFPLLEKKVYKRFNQILKEPEHTYLSHPEKVLRQFNVKTLHVGESLETLLKIFTLIQNYSDISLFVQTSPSLCCPSLITEAMSGQIEDMTGIPVVTIEYDGTGSRKNSDIIPYLKYPRKVKTKARRPA